MRPGEPERLLRQTSWRRFAAGEPGVDGAAQDVADRPVTKLAPRGQVPLSPAEEVRKHASDRRGLHRGGVR